MSFIGSGFLCSEHLTATRSFLCDLRLSPCIHGPGFHVPELRRDSIYRVKGRWSAENFKVHGTLVNCCISVWSKGAMFRAHYTITREEHHCFPRAIRAPQKLSVQKERLASEPFWRERGWQWAAPTASLFLSSVSAEGASSQCPRRLLRSPAGQFLRMIICYERAFQVFGKQQARFL